MEYYFVDFAEDGWRLKRLQKAVRLASAILGISIEQLNHLILEVADNNGRLHVMWAYKQTIQQELAFQAAWKECGEDVVTHSVPKVRS